MVAFDFGEAKYTSHIFFRALKFAKGANLKPKIKNKRDSAAIIASIIILVDQNPSEKLWRSTSTSFATKENDSALISAVVAKLQRKNTEVWDFALF